MVVANFLAKLFDYRPFSKLKRVEVQLLNDIARLWINLDDTINAEDISPNISINELKLVDQIAPYTSLVFNRKLAQLLETLSVNSGDLIATIADI